MLTGAFVRHRLAPVCILNSSAKEVTVGMRFQQWFDGIYLIGQFNWFRTGCWLLTHDGEAAVLEMPPASLDEPDPVSLAEELLSQLGASVKHLLCTHSHCDHFSRRTYRR